MRKKYTCLAEKNALFIQGIKGKINTILIICGESHRKGLSIDKNVFVRGHDPPGLLTTLKPFEPYSE